VLDEGTDWAPVVSNVKSGYDAYVAFKEEDWSSFAWAIVGVVSGKVLGRLAREVFGSVTKGVGNGANSATNALKLEKQLASQEQLGQLSKGGGTVISQPAKQADRIAAQTGRNPANIQKVSSDARVARDGQQIQTHSFRDAHTNELIEPKTIIGD